MKNCPKLGVNIDHVATLRQARGTTYPSPLLAALAAQEAGAAGITLHLREDRRHIQAEDVWQVREKVSLPLNLEMAVTPEMVSFARSVLPPKVCLVPEKRQELTTEGGLDLTTQNKPLQEAIHQLTDCGCEVSLFIDPTLEAVEKAKALGAPVIELHTGAYAEAQTAETQYKEYQRLLAAAAYAVSLGLTVNAGHGLHYENTKLIAQIPHLHELNIGHAIVSRAILVGFFEAVREMKALLETI